MSVTYRTRMMGLMPNNKYRYLPQCVQVYVHAGRRMTAREIDFISSVQCLPLESIAILMLKHEDNFEALELVRIGMLFHGQKDDFDGYLKKNSKDPRVKKAQVIWNGVKNNGKGIFGA